MKTLSPTRHLLPTQVNAARGLTWLALTVGLVPAAYIAHGPLLLSTAWYPCWLITDGLIVFGIWRALRAGIFYHPIVLIGSSYGLLLVAGALSYPWLRGRPLNPVTFNLIGLGATALFGGMAIGLQVRRQHTTTPEAPEIRHTTVLYGLAVAGLLASAIMFFKFRGLPILAANPNEAKVNFLLGNGVLNLFFKGLPVFAMALLYVRHHLRQSYIPAHLYFGIVMIIILAAGYRSTTLISLGEYVALYYILTQKTLPRKLLWIAGTAALIFLATWGAYRRGQQGLAGAVNEIDIVINARPALIEVIVHHFDPADFFHGTLYVHDFVRFLPGTQANANVALKYAIFQNAEAMPDMAGVTPSVIGEAYMNFGQPGVFWVMLLLGFVLAATYRYFQARPHFTRTTFFLTLVFGMAGGIQSGIGLKLIHLTQFWCWVAILGALLHPTLLNRKQSLKHPSL